MIDRVIHIKTTLSIDDSVMQRLGEEAAQRSQTMSESAEAYLRLVLDEPEQAGDQTLKPLQTALPESGLDVTARCGFNHR